MGYRELSRMEIVEVVRRWQVGESQRGIARVTGLARETVSKYLAAAGTLGLLPNGPPPNEEQVVALVRLGSVVGAPMPPLPYVAPPPAAVPAIESVDERDSGASDEVAEAGGGSLATVAKAAAMKAERAAIEHTLRQVHWNRRKAAQILGVSYKTLLNKIKECGISRA